MARKQKIQTLYQLAPGFESDRDDSWYQYLTHANSSYLRAQRNEFHVLNDILEQRELELKEQTKGTEKHTSIKAQIATVRRDLDTVLNNLLHKIPLLKAEALKTLERTARVNTVQSSSKKRRHEDEVSEFSADYLSNFLPSHLTSSAPKPKPPPARQEPQRPAAVQRAALSKEVPAQPSKPARDTYLDGVKEENIAVMIKIRALAEKYECRDKILSALRSIRKRDKILDALEMIKRIAARPVASKS